MAKAKPKTAEGLLPAADYDGLLGEVVSLLETARRTSTRAVNAMMTATYWEIGRRIVEIEQGGEGRADYGQAVLERLAKDLTARFGRGFSKQNLYLMRAFHMAYRTLQTPSGESATPRANVRSTEASEPILQTLSGESDSRGLQVSAKSHPQHETTFTTIGRLAHLFGCDRLIEGLGVLRNPVKPVHDSSRQPFRRPACGPRASAGVSH
ncbi:MAG: hypothetical protein KY476_06285 [Planctomycetes bacterium]|nr:hypothetical protein [Planctomycetota bacterium]